MWFLLHSNSNIKISLVWNRLRHTSSLNANIADPITKLLQASHNPRLNFFFSTSVVEAISCDTCKCRVSLTLNQYVRRWGIFYRTYNYVSWKVRVERYNKYDNLRDYCIFLFNLNCPRVNFIHFARHIVGKLHIAWDSYSS